MIDSVEENAERLRMALPLMTRNGIPATPENYAVWYHYISGDKPALSQEIDKQLQSGEPFSNQLNERLYQTHISSANMSALEQVRHQLESTLHEACEELGRGGNSAERYGRVLEEFNSSADGAGSLQEVFGLLRVVLDETKEIRQSMDQFRLEFERKGQEMAQLRQELEQVRRQAANDPLTGLANRATFNNAIDSAIDQSDSASPRLCLVMLDIDHFKRVNDKYGHLVGDKVIRFVAEVLRKSVKGKDTAARYGGEEFALLLPDTPLEGAQALAEQIRKTIESTNLVRTGTRESLGQITISSGVSAYRSGEEPADWIQRTDQALYLSKKRGRNRVSLANN